MQNSDEIQIQRFFDVLRERKNSFEENYQYFAPQLAPQFNVFSFIRPDEMRLSEIIAALLNSKHNPIFPYHEQGDLFLRLFFEQFDMECYPPSQGSVRVSCETATDAIENSSRRIDIQVEFGNGDYCLAIENKPWAGDQKNQLADYGMNLQKKFKKWLLVYLHGSGKEAGEYSLPTDIKKLWQDRDHYKEVGFDFVVKWLIECEAQAKSDRVRNFLRDFIIYCEETFLGVNKMVDGQLIKQFALQKENIRFALEIAQQHDAIKAELYKKFESAIRATASRLLPEWQIAWPSSITEQYAMIRFRKGNWRKYSLAMEFGAIYCNNLYYGIAKQNKDHEDIPEIRQIFQGSGAPEIWWPWWRHVAEPYRNWRNETQPWVDIADIDERGESKMSKVLFEQYLLPITLFLVLRKKLKILLSEQLIKLWRKSIILTNSKGVLLKRPPEWQK